MPDTTMTIGGHRVSGTAHFDVINPATGAVFAQAPTCSATQLDAAMDAAKGAFSSWRRDVEVRRQALLAAARTLREHAGSLAPLLTQEQGKPLKKATGEVMGAAAWFKHTARLEMRREVVQDSEQTRIEVVRRPLGVVAAITPWNYPIILAAWKIAPALLAGNTVVLKPSPYTPLSTLAMVGLLQEVFPPGVLNCVAGGDQLGAWMTEHPAVKKIAFTGSVATGKRVAAAASSDLKRLTLELGGNDPAIVLPGVEPSEAVAAQVFWGAFENSGQVCSAIKRLYVPEGAYAGWVAALAAQADAARVGDGFEEGVDFGPVNNAAQFERVKELVADAGRSGARIAAGGEGLPGPGYFYRPTIVAGLPISDMSPGVRLVDEEQFGPALPVLSYRDVDDAVAHANATHFGLGASVWSPDAEAATALASRLECGTVWVNQHLQMTPLAPFGGHKWSGIGVENGRWGLEAYTALQTLNIARSLAT